MKRILYSVLISSICLASCCKKIQVVPTIKFEYPNLEFGDVVVASSYNSVGSIDYLYSKMVDVENDTFTYSLSVLEKNEYYTIDVFTLTADSASVDSVLIYSDLIANVQFELNGKCKNKLENFSFTHNGELTTETVIIK